MMTKSVTFILLLLSLQVFAQDQIEIQLEEKGFRLSSESVSKNFSMMRLTPDQDNLIKYITRINPAVSKEDAFDIATNVLKISSCFKIDPWILTGLIQKESSFDKTAVSPTNAAGLTQFTSSGFREVNDQLGLHDKVGATEAAIAYFNGQIKECVDPNWIHLWTRVAVEETHEDFFNLMKAEVKKDIPLAITYGAILLKTYVAYVDNKSTDASMSETYYKALQIYNGEEGDAKVKYAKAIFNNLKALYPIPVNFDFLD